MPKVHKVKPAKQQKYPGAIGWMATVLAEMGRKRCWALPVSGKTDIVITQGQPLYLAQTQPSQVIRQCQIAAQGSASKGIGTALAPAVLADFTINLGTIKSFGVRVKIADSLNGFKYGVYNIQLLDGATVIGDVFIRPATNVADVVILGISNNGGQASIIPIANPQVKLVNANSSMASGNSVTAETLNERDLGIALPGALCD